MIVRRVLLAVLLTSLLTPYSLPATSFAKAEPLVIAASPSVKAPIEALAQAFEAAHPDVTVRIYFDSALDLRRTIASVENRGRYFIGTGPVHLLAPGDDELLDRLEQKYYVLPGNRRSYAAVPLVLVVPESLVEAPASFEAVVGNPALRIAVADPGLTELGRATQQVLHRLGIAEAQHDRLDVAADARGVLDHLLLGQADVGILFGPDAVQEQERVRVAAVAPPVSYQPTVHSIAMERSCPNRILCDAFLAFTQTAEAVVVLRRLGYASPSDQSHAHVTSSR